MAKKPAEPQSLQLLTLSGVYEAAHDVTRLIPIDTTATYTQLENHLKKIVRNKDVIIELFNALQRLSDHHRALGATTLIKPLDHPLVTRREFVPKDRA